MAEEPPGLATAHDVGDEPAPSAPPARATAPRSGFRGEALVPTAAVIALCAVLVGAGRTQVQRHQVPYMPDIWETVLATASAGHGAQFVGPWSRLGMFHPGPLFFYWSAPLLRATDLNPGALSLATALLVCACIVGIVVRVGRTADATAATVAALVCAIAVYQLGVPGLLAPWNPTVLVLPTALGLVCAADAIGRASLWSIAVGVIAGSFVIQCHIGTVALGAVIVSACLVGGMVARRRAAEPGRPAFSGRELAVLGAAIVLPWVPVVIDQAVGTGNAGNVIVYLANGHAPAGSLPAQGDQIGVVDAVRNVGSIAALSEPDTASWAGISLPEGRDHRPGVRSDAVFALLVIASIASATRRVRARPDDALRRLAVWCSRIGLLALAVQLVAAIRVHGAFRIYLVTGAAGVGMVLWLALALVALAWARAHWPGRATEVDLGVAAVGLLGSFVLVALVPTAIGGFETRADIPIVAAMAEAADGSTIVLRPDHEPAIPKYLELAWALEATGHDVAVRGPFDYRFSDQERDRSTAGGLEVTIATDDQSPPPGCRTIGLYKGATVCTTGS